MLHGSHKGRTYLNEVTRNLIRPFNEIADALNRQWDIGIMRYIISLAC